MDLQNGSMIKLFFFSVNLFVIVIALLNNLILNVFCFSYFLQLSPRRLKC